MEILAIKIRNSSEIEGIKIGEHTEGNSLEQTSKIKQFADDTTLTMKNEEDVKRALDIVQVFGEFSGLHLNKLTNKNRRAFGLELENGIEAGCMIYR